MLESSILVSGPTIAKDEDLVSRLQRVAFVIRNLKNSRIETIIKSQKVDLILFEILLRNASEIKMVKKVKELSPGTAVILIDGHRELLAEALSYGAMDAFRKPYKSSLVVERVSAILGP